jgi:ABC-type transport system substrate-binding protein
MPPLRSLCWFVAASLAGAALAGCSSGADETLGVVVIGSASDPFASGSDLPPAAQLVRAATAEGLVGLDEHGRVVPALAERWIVYDDGMSYIFRLRGGRWADGSAIEAADAAAALRRAFAAARGSAMGAGLEDVRSIVVRAGRVVEIQLSRPNPDFLRQIAQPEFALLRSGRGTGPMQLERDGVVAALAPVPPGRRGLPRDPAWAESVRPIRLSARGPERALALFADGRADIILGGTLADYPEARGVGMARATVQIDPAAGLFGLAVANESGFLGDPANREALAKAIDRDALASAIDAPGWTPTTRIVAYGMGEDDGSVGERWNGQDMEQRRAAAAVRVSAWAGAGGGPVRLRIALPPGKGAGLLFDRLSADWRAIGVEARRVGLREPADLALLDSIARFQAKRWFLGELSCASSRGLCSEAADRLVRLAGQAEDPAERLGLLAEAEAELTKANVFIPLGSPLRWSIVRRRFSGFVANRWAVHPLMPLATIPK